MSKTAKKSVGFLQSENHECIHSWPEDCYCQCGENGIVLTPSSLSLRDAIGDPIDIIVDALAVSAGEESHMGRVTAFFEAFPRSPNTFIRGEGKSVDEAEKEAWKKYQHIVSCPKHEFERRQYTNGAGICKNCRLFMSNVFDPTEKCVVCVKPTYYTVDTDGNWYCEEHKDQIPLNKMTTNPPKLV